MESGRGREDGSKSREGGTLTLKIRGLGQELRNAGGLWERETAPEASRGNSVLSPLDFSLLRLEISITVEINVLL